MEKEEKVMVLLLFMTLTSLMAAYLCFGSELTAGQETGKEVKTYTPESAEGEKVFIQAEVLSKQLTYKGGHLLLQVDCNSEVLSVFIPKTAGAEAFNVSIKKGDYISVTGTVSEYEGKKEIKVERKEDVLLNDHSSSE